MALALQFGARDPDVRYRERACAFGVAVRDGRIACVRVERGPASYYDLPGGAIDPGEDEARALVREFREETGLVVRPVSRFAEAGQYFRRSGGEPVHNEAGFWMVEILDEAPASKVEDDHRLVWLGAGDALAGLRHDAHAWAVTAWLRANA